MKTILLFLIMLPGFLLAQTRKLRVMDSLTNLPVSGALVKLQGQTLQTDSAGTVLLGNLSGEMAISHITYRPFNGRVLRNESPVIALVPVSHTLQDVPVYTGYQETQRGRVTGSVVSIDKELLNRRVSPDLISRLEDVTSGLAINRSSSSSPFNIRGQSTLFGNARPLIIIDNFPYDGNLNNINPNDVETVTVLRDAAAASIWGARAGNGVIVITTKKGRSDGRVNISLNTNVMTGDKPDLFYRPKMTVSDYIDTEKLLFSRGFYRSAETSADKVAISPVVELLIAARDGKMSAAEATNAIDALKSFDLRAEQDRWLNRRAFNTQTLLSLSGSQGKQRYYLSGGFDRGLSNSRGNENDRYTFTGNHSYSFLKDKMQFETGVFYTKTETGSAGVNLTTAQPYSRLADDQGNPLAVTAALRRSFEETARSRGLADWRFIPLEELEQATSVRKSTDYRINLGLSYTILTGLKAEVRYNYGQTFDELRDLKTSSSYFARNLVNMYSTINADGSITRGIPQGGIQDITRGRVSNENVRGQLNYNRTFNPDHTLGLLAGAEKKALNNVSNTNRLYGYNDELALGSFVNYTGTYRSFANPSRSLSIPYVDNEVRTTDRYLSYYSLGNYSYKNRYFVSASARLDQSNLVGVRTNQRGVPLYSIGASWLLSGERFYAFKALPHLQLRASYGYNGNISKLYSGLITVNPSNGADSPTKLPFASISNPPNPDLRWERVRVINAGLEFATAGRRISGNVEVYFKKNTDLLGLATFPPSTGIQFFKGNTGTSQNYGIDVNLSSINLKGAVQWNTTLLYSLSKDKVLDYMPSANLATGSSSPQAGYPLYAIAAYAWAGLDGQTGDPLGYLNGQVSRNYNQIINSTTTEMAVYFGSAMPTMFGALRNDFRYRNLSLSVNISYRLGYYYYRESVAYGNNMGLGTHGDFAARWQKPGDEAFTQIPSAPLANVSGRDDFYRYSTALVEKGDHIRLQDIQLSYQLRKATAAWLPVSGLRMYAYLNNIGVLWAENRQGVDPDFRTGPPPRTLAFGIQAEF
ncbi:SusC/RagA family TonB-linked outer membrane protein [Pedobacter sp. SYP-B3415]|uniref:SusC/RagA family TonB-linked outer membrane protein n=1 Tax=Pedobacter sp. SYP-B3415 TaxID=2496641 RepID=UPI00101BB4A0|nr:SusC/RagA family TonB-linked outer membrane protein [Pedobacter sp. SYP-B3415]